MFTWCSRPEGSWGPPCQDAWSLQGRYSDLLLLWLHCNLAVPTDESWCPTSSWPSTGSLKRPAKYGARQAYETIAQLEKQAFLDVTGRNPGLDEERIVHIRVNSETRSGTQRTTPDSDASLRLGHEFVTSGWLAALTGRAVAALLVAVTVERSDGRLPGLCYGFHREIKKRSRGRSASPMLS